MVLADGSWTVDHNIIVSATARRFWVDNSGGTYNATVKTSAGTGIAVAAGASMPLICDGTNVVDPLNAIVLGTPTLTSPVLNDGVSGTAVLDEDLMVSDSDTKLATQQSIKRYVDAHGLVQRVDATPYTTYATKTTNIPNDNTKPQITEGDQIVTVAITPTKADNKLVLRAHSGVCGASGAISGIMALFQVGTSDALAVSVRNFAGSGGSGQVFESIEYTMIAGGTSEITFSVRIGGTAGGSLYTNGVSSGALYGGASAFRLSVEEIEV